jgi:hypothetical protein
MTKKHRVNSMGYAILRTQKLKSKQEVRRSLKHSFRAQETPNADPMRTPENTHIGAKNTLDAMQKIEACLPSKIRKNGVWAIEYLITASPEDMQGKTRAQQDAYFTDARQWLEDRHSAENVVYAGIHRDETTPHMYAYVVPIDGKGNLNCRAFLGGAKALSKMQTDFADRVGKKHALQRGIEGSKARHSKVRQFYADLERKPLNHYAITEESLKPKTLKSGLIFNAVESNEVVAERLQNEIRKHYQPVIAEVALTRTERIRSKEIEDTARVKGLLLRNAQERLQELEMVFQGLTKEQLVALTRHAINLRQSNQEA